MRESCLVYCYSGIQSLFEVVLLYTFYTDLSSVTARKSFPKIKDKIIFVVIDSKTKFIAGCA